MIRSIFYSLKMLLSQKTIFHKVEYVQQEFKKISNSLCLNYEMYLSSAQRNHINNYFSSEGKDQKTKWLENYSINIL
jgi:hypothetical protein